MEDCHRSKEGQGRQGRFLCGQAPGEALALGERANSRNSRMGCRSPGGTDWPGLPCHRGRGPETGCSEQAFLDKMCVWALGNTQL